MSRCDYCGTELGPSQVRFCCDRHRSAWHREHDPKGIVRSVRRLASNRIGVLVHFTDEAALRFRIGEGIVLGKLLATQESENA